MVIVATFVCTYCAQVVFQVACLLSTQCEL